MYVKRLVEGGKTSFTWYDERIFLASRPHWFCTVRRGLPGLALLLLGLTTEVCREQITRVLAVHAPDLRIPLMPSQLSPDAIFALGGLISLLVGVAVLLWALLDRYFTEYAITMALSAGGRIIKISGILSRQTISVPLHMVNDLVLT